MLIMALKLQIFILNTKCIRLLRQHTTTCTHREFLGLWAWNNGACQDT